jgi:hypothetical protein
VKVERGWNCGEEKYRRHFRTMPNMFKKSGKYTIPCNHIYKVGEMKSERGSIDMPLRVNLSFISNKAETKYTT